MTRIIAGFAGSITIAVPRTGTRPTSDRVREAIFSALDSRNAIEGAHVLDLYSGSGALGLEAASRGATRVTLVDRVITTSQQNAARVLKQAPPGARPEITAIAQSVHAFLTASRSFWDLVFIDPPYELSNEDLGNNLEALTPRLSPGATLVIERSARTPAPNWPEQLEWERTKSYGETVLHWLSRS